jgi:Poly A polymerase head domain/Probable RNA and SrmB- binding site of polymerase A
MRELAQRLLAGEQAWVVGGAVRDELLGREIVDLDVAYRDPRAAAVKYARASGGSPFPLSERHGAWRVALDHGRTVDFTPLRGSIEDDLATRDFTVNAIAVPLEGGEAVDPYEGGPDLEARRLRHVSETVFDDDPLRLLRAVRFVDQFGFRLDERTETLIREKAALVGRASGERIIVELEQLSVAGLRLLDALGLLAPLGGSAAELRDGDSAAIRLPRVFGTSLGRFPISNERRGLLRAVLRAEPPRDDSPRELYRFRRATEPWALEALEYLGATELREAVEEARRRDPAEPLLRGDELGVPPGPEVGRLLTRIEEERAAGTISTREEALELVRREQAEGERPPRP